jgi:nucleoside-diphosphate-sugar epimerase
MAKRYLVTGGTGFIGRALVRRLVRDGFAVRVLDNNSRGEMESWLTWRAASSFSRVMSVTRSP